jgi:hypothetical protein
VSNPICNFYANKICLNKSLNIVYGETFLHTSEIKYSKHRDRKKDRKKKKGFKQTKTTKNNMDWSE